MPEASATTLNVRFGISKTWLCAGFVGLAALVVFSFGLRDEPHFADESAYYSQSAYADLIVFDRNHQAWLDYAGFDLPPLPKYLIGWSLRAFGHPRPAPSTAWQWYRGTDKRFETPDSLLAARVPSVIMGVVGCLAIFAFGTIGVDRRVGFLSSLFLMAEPLYRLHARRAMSDTTAEALMLSALAVGLWAWVRFVKGENSSRVALSSLGSGLFLGLAVLSKLNGVIAGFVLLSWIVLAWCLPTVSSRSRWTLLFTALVSGALAFGVFVALNPFLTAHPRGPIEPRLTTPAAMSFVDRVKFLKDHRVEASRQGQRLFPHNSLSTPLDRCSAVVVQGFGRFGLFGPSHSSSVVRFDPVQDRGAWIWLPWVVLGGVATVQLGLRQRIRGEPPAAWCLLLHALTALATVSAFIPLA